MAVTKASASGLAGSKFKDASAGTTKIVDFPDAPTIGTAVRSGVSISVPFTAATTGGTATSFVATGSTGGVTGTASSSPILVSGLTHNTSYTFTVAAVNSAGTSPSSASSNAVTAVVELVWQAAQTFNTTQNYTADANVGEIAMVAFSGGFAGSGGGAGLYYGGDVGATGAGGGGGGAGGSAASGVFDVPDGGATYLLTIGASGGGVSSIGTLLNSNATGNATSKVAGNVQGGSGEGGNITVGTGLFTPVTTTYGGAGGAGGSANGFSVGGGAGGSSPFGGAGGNASGGNIGGAGSSANGLSGGGGGGGGSRGGCCGGRGGNAGAGGSGRIVIYEKKPNA